MFGLASRARWTAEDCRLAQTRGARRGMSFEREEKGGWDRRRAADSGERWDESVRKGGRRTRRSRSSGGSSDDEGLGREVTLLGGGFVGSTGWAADMALIRRWCFAVLIRCCFRP